MGVEDGEVGGINCCDYHRWGRGEGEAVTEECGKYIHVHSTGVQDALLDYSINETKTCQNYPTPPPIVF